MRLPPFSRQASTSFAVSRYLGLRRRDEIHASSVPISKRWAAEPEKRIVGTYHVWLLLAAMPAIAGNLGDSRIVANRASQVNKRKRFCGARRNSRAVNGWQDPW